MHAYDTDNQGSYETDILRETKRNLGKPHTIELPLCTVPSTQRS